MRIIDWKVLKTMVPFSRQHLHRLEKLGKFPRRVRLGAHRVGWWLHEIEDWLGGLPRG
jgi:prophage regulatory protein